MRLSLALVAVVGLAACSRAGSDDSFEWSKEVPAGSVVHIRDGAGNINVTRASGQEALVRGSRRWQHSRSSDVRFVVENHDGAYYICAMWRNSGKCDGKYRGRNTSSLLSMLSLFHRSSDASADFDVQLPANVVVDAQTNVGSVQIDGITGGVTAHSLNGTVRATNVSGPLTLNAINGDVRLVADSLSPSDPVQLRTINGSVHAELPAATQGNFDLQTTNGVVQSAIPLPAETSSRANRHLFGQIGSATRNVRLHTVNGAVVLTTRGAAASQD
ncbi:MAG TPA: DUF4097 family beta strand repeat-containing protein [Gemmatimonadaceae bacterium]|jgi:hypothetical protein